MKPHPKWLASVGLIALAMAISYHKPVDTSGIVVGTGAPHGPA